MDEGFPSYRPGGTKESPLFYSTISRLYDRVSTKS